MSNSVNNKTPLRVSQVLVAELSAIYGNENELINELALELSNLPPDDEFGKQEAIAAKANQLSPSALCLSGEGMHSTAFGLGVLQALAEGKLLSHFNYLSTVSDGGHIGCWLSALLHYSGSSSEVLSRLADARDLLRIECIRDQINQFESLKTISYVVNYVLNSCILIPALWLIVIIPKINIVMVQSARASSRLQFLAVSVDASMALLMIISAWYTTANRGSNRSLSLFGLNEQISFLLADLLPLVLAGAAFTWVVNRPQEYVSWLTEDSPGLADVAFSVMTLYLIGFGLARLTYRPTHEEHHHVPIQWGRDLAAWLLAGLITGNVLWVGAAGYVALPDLMTLVPAHCTIETAACAAAGAAAPMSAPITLDAKALLAILGMPYFLASVLVGRITFVLLRCYSPYGEFERQRLENAAGWYLRISWIWTIGATIVLFASASAAGVSLMAPDIQGWLAPAGFVSGTMIAGVAMRRGLPWKLVIAVLALVGATFVLDATSSVTPIIGLVSGLVGLASALIAKISWDAKFEWLENLTNSVLSIASIIFTIVTIITSSLVIDWIIFGQPLQSTLLFEYDFGHETIPAAQATYHMQWVSLLICTSSLFSFWLVVGWFVNPNMISQYALYRRKLIDIFLRSAYVGAPGRHRPDSEHRNFDIHVADLWQKARDSNEWQPFHVINMALNVIVGDGSTPLRKSESFVVTPLACGHHGLGYRPTTRYGSAGRGITLGTAMTISSARLNVPSTFKTSLPMRLVFSLFNVGYGWWLGNPGTSGQSVRSKESPSFAFGPTLSDLFGPLLGLSSGDRAYVHLSDGGQFEQLGLHEILRRRCTLIVVIDAGPDKAYVCSALGNAISQARIHLGVDISFRTLAKFREPQPADPSWRRPKFAVGTIKYPEPETKDGLILYIKPTLHGNEPPDIAIYAQAHPEFPHDPTYGASLDEGQFESYRALGRHSMAQMMDDEIVDLQTFLETLKKLQSI